MKMSNTNNENRTLKKAKKARVIPGFGLTMGVTVTMLSLIVLIPLASVFAYALKLSPNEFFTLISKETVRNAFITSIGSSFIAALINVVFGLIIAWVLVKYEFPGKRLMDGMIELPFGIKISYTRIGLLIALVFIGIPFIVRAVQPVLEKMDDQYEEAAYMLGATPTRTFFKVILPELRPALLTGFGLAFARGIGEYGSVIYISGNSAKEHTQMISYVIMQKLNYIDYKSATAIALVMLIISFVMLFVINIIQVRQARRVNAQ